MLDNPATITIDDVTYEMHVARIEDTTLGDGDRGIMIAWLHLNFGGSGQSAGGHVLDEREDDDFGNYTRRGTAYGLDYIMQILHTVGADNWENVKGRTIYVLKKDRYGSIDGIANLYDPETKNFVFAKHSKEFFERWPNGR